MLRPSFLRLLLLATLALVAGCGPRWTILAQARPDPLLGAKLFYVEPIHYDPLVVGSISEQQYLAGKTAGQRDSWLTDKSDTSNRYIASLVSALPEVRFVTQPVPGAFIVRPIVSFIEPGFYAAIAAAPTVVRMRVQVLTAEGVPVDDILIPSAIGASLIYPSSGQRLRLAGEDLGRVTAEYLKRRIFPPS